MSGEPGRAFIKTPILQVLLAGFATLLILVGVLTYISISQLDSVNQRMSELDMRYISNTKLTFDLLDLVRQIETEARVRRVLLGSSVKVPNSVLNGRIEHLKDSIKPIIAEVQQSQLAQTTQWQDFNQTLTQFLNTAVDSSAFELHGIEDYELVMTAYEAFSREVANRRTDIDKEVAKLRGDAKYRVRLTSTIIILLGLSVAGMTVFEIRRRLRELDRSNRANMAAREFNRNILNSMVEALFTLSSEGLFISANQTMRQIIGLPRGQVLGAHYRDVFGPNAKLVSLLDDAQRDVKRRKRYAGRVELGSDGGRYDVYASPLIAAGQKDGLIITLIDVTEMERVQDELRRQAALAMIGQMTAQVAHEIKNPIGGIKLNLSFLKRKYRDNEEAIDVVSDLEAQVDRLHRTVLEINQFARPRELELRPVNLNNLIDEQLGLINDKIVAKKIKVIRDYQEDLPLGQYDYSDLSKVFINLLLNSVEASADNRSIQIKTGIAPHNYAEIIIKDEGSGMNKQTLDRLFEPFYTTKSNGTGLGMATAKKIIEQHNGLIEVESKEGKGTTIHVFLPTDLARTDTVYIEPVHARSN